MSRRTERIIRILHLPKADGTGPIPRCIILQSHSGRRVQLHRVDVSTQCNRGSSLLAPATFIGAMDDLPAPSALAGGTTACTALVRSNTATSAGLMMPPLCEGVGGSVLADRVCLLPLTLPQGEEKVFQSSRDLMRVARRNAGTRLAARARQRH